MALLLLQYQVVHPEQPLRFYNDVYFMTPFFQQFQEFKLKSVISMKVRLKVQQSSFIYGHSLSIKHHMIVLSDYVVIISCVILVGLFSIQHHGTHRVAFLFAPVVAAWLFCISGIVIYNIIHWNPQIYQALSPVYMSRFLRTTGIEGWLSLWGVVLSITGVETMFADVGHFSAPSIKIAFTCIVYPCLIRAYMGEAAFLSKLHEDIQRRFYKATSEAVFWPVFIVAPFAAVVGSQEVISATFSIVSQCCALNCFPRVKIIHTSSRIYPEINWILMCLCLAVTVGLRDTDMIGHAYGFAVTTVMFVTTCLTIVVILIVWKQGIIKSITFLLLFGTIELLYISASICKTLEGVWIPLVLAFIFMGIIYTWNYGTMKKHQIDVENKVSMSRILCLGPCLGIARVPKVGFFYTNLASDIPAIFGHFVTNLPAFHQVLVFASNLFRSLMFVNKHACSLAEYGMFPCVIRYGYKDLPQENYNFGNKLLSGIVEFVETEESVPEPTHELFSYLENPV